jgi:hypothetical protein
MGLFCYTIFMGLFIDIYVFLNYFHKHILSVIAMSGVVIKLYFLWVWLGIRLVHIELISFLHIFMMIGGGFTFLSVICRMAFRYYIYPPIFAEHRRLYSEFFDFWYSAVFTRSHLGSDSDGDDWFAGSILHLLSHIECIWDYVMVAIANSLTFIGFVVSTISSVILFVMMNLTFLVLSFLLLALFVSYPVLMVAELLLALCFHHSSESGEFRFFILRFYFFLLDIYMRFVFCIELDMMGWIELRQEYINLCLAAFFSLCYGFLGSWAFLLLEDLPSAGPGLEVRLSREALSVVVLEAALSSMGGVFVSIAAGVATGSPLARVLFAVSLFSLCAQLALIWRNIKRKDMLVTMASNPKNYIVTTGGGRAGWSDEESAGGEAEGKADEQQKEGCYDDDDQDEENDDE